MKDNVKKYIPCIYNVGVTCPPAGRKCDKCGWKPDVAQDRLARICHKKRIKLPKAASES